MIFCVQESRGWWQGIQLLVKELARKAQSEVSTARKRKLQVETELEALAHAILVEEVLKNI